jgi:poly(3-hydroxybutyrate) depolymerase
MKNIRKNFIFAGILLLAGMVLFQGQTFYGKRRTGFYKTAEDGAAFGYYVPPQMDENNAHPLVVIFGKKVTDVMKWKDTATREGLIVLCIQPKYGGVWNWEWDVDRALKKIKEVKVWHPVDTNRVWATGFESGGNFALLMTINHPKVFAQASVVEAKTYGFEILEGDSGTRLDPFNYTNKTEQHRPLWLLNFTQSQTVSAEDLEKTREYLEKFGYPAVYEKVEGEPYPPTQKIIQQMYGWLKTEK